MMLASRLGPCNWAMSHREASINLCGYRSCDKQMVPEATGATPLGELVDASDNIEVTHGAETTTEDTT